MDSRPIGIFDSGLGGLTALRALRRFLPDENIVYFADSGRVPNGEKSLNQLRCMAEQNYAFISSHDVKAILVACGTMSSNCGDLLEAWPVPTVGVMYSSADWMRRLEGKGPIAVIATEASIRSGSYQRVLKEACAGREVIAVSCPDFVPLIESGHSGAEDPLVRKAVARYLAPIRGADGLLLGCTHYGIIAQALRDYLGPKTALVSASTCGAAQLCQYLIENGLTGGSGQERFLTSGSAAAFAGTAAAFLGHSLHSPVESVPCMEI